MSAYRLTKCALLPKGLPKKISCTLPEPPFDDVCIERCQLQSCLTAIALRLSVTTPACLRS